MIQGFKFTDMQSLFEGRRVKGWGDIETEATRKLVMLNRDAILGNLNVPPQNSLEALKKDRRCQHSICINDQWQLRFRCTPAGPENVEIVDYH